MHAPTPPLPLAVTAEEGIVSATSRMRAVEIPGPAGRLEGLVNAPDEGVAQVPYCALICHPHPAIGGTMHFKQVYQMMKAFTGLGLPVLRFNFRGTGQSEGTYDFGRGEVHDVHAALDWMEREFASLPVIVAGYSFGSNIALRACCGDPRVQGTVLLGVPMQWAGRVYKFNFLPRCQQPKLFITGTNDQYATQDSVNSLAASSPHSTVVWVQEADHFFIGKLDQVRSAIGSWVEANFLPAAKSAPSLDGR
jgi:alpha/beta superfamily hydrolase